MRDTFSMRFTNTEATAADLRQQAAMLHDLQLQLHMASQQLYASGLHGAFLDDLQARTTRLSDQLQALADETQEAGTDLQTVVAWARQLDRACALDFGRYTPAMIDQIGVSAGGGMNQAAHIDQSISRLQAVRAGLVAQLQALDPQLSAPLPALMNRLFGLHDDYTEMQSDLNASVARVDARLETLAAERDRLTRAPAAPATSSPLGELLADAPPAAPPADTTPPASTVSPVPATPPASVTVRNQFTYQYDGRGDDRYACSLYAQAGVLEALGYNFDEELKEARDLGTEAGWYTAGSGSRGLGQPFAANDIPYETYGFEDRTITPEAALDRLESELTAGHYAVVNIDATKLSAYAGATGVAGHSVWVIGTQTDADGYTTHIVTNDSYWGSQRAYPVDEFLTAWGSQFNYYGVFAQKPE